MSRQPSIMDHIQEQLDPDAKLTAAKSKALDLFSEICESIGFAKARRVFAQLGNPLTPKPRKQINDLGLLDRLDMMVKTDKDGKSIRGSDGLLVFEPNVQRLAQQIAAENAELNKALPRERWQPTNQASIDKHIRRLVDRREARRAARKLAAEGQSTSPPKEKTARKRTLAPKRRTPKRQETRG
jgi:hypothetical protein